MKKIKLVVMALLFSAAMLHSPEVEAKKRTYVYVWSNGCVGTHTEHSILFGLIQWDSYSVVKCPEGVEPPQL